VKYQRTAVDFGKLADTCSTAESTKRTVNFITFTRFRYKHCV